MEYSPLTPLVAIRDRYTFKGEGLFILSGGYSESNTVHLKKFVRFRLSFNASLGLVHMKLK